MTLSELKPGQTAVVEEIRTSRHGQGLCNRLEAMGIIANKPVKVIRQAPLGGPLHVQIGLTTEVAIRRSEAAMVAVKFLETES
ncbi:MAG: hypothetical protein N5P05_003814 [Chroococcopsis gigantea SAG 12.99]|nr:ferrous iron transport protein A [Chlorogloea purpurea SAG 13.99]MDV3002208.1 hypothetical protein [Chroococcopsis gigantea SAG 12.99]